MEEKATVAVLRGYTKRHVGVLAAAANAFKSHIAGGTFDGTVSGFWNYAQEPMLDAVVALRDEKNEAKGNKIWGPELTALHDVVMGDLGPDGELRLHSSYKTATWLRGLMPNPHPRAPMWKLRIDEVVAIRDAMKKAGLQVIPDSEIRKVYPALA